MAPRRSPAIAYRTPKVRIIGYAVSEAAPGTRWEPGTGRRSGSKPPLLVGRALRWPWRDRKDAGILEISKVPALHREAERDTTGSISRQPLVHTWIGLLVQGKRRCVATLDVIRRGGIKLRLTLQF